MAFQVIWSNRSKKDLKLLDKKTASRIVDKAGWLASQDTIFLEKVKGTGYFKHRVGHYRILIEKLPATKKLFIRKVRHRKNFYKNV